MRRQWLQIIVAMLLLQVCAAPSALQSLSIDDHVEFNTGPMRQPLARPLRAPANDLGPDGQAFHGDPANNENWYAYGVPVLAVKAGSVTDLHDGIPENNPASEKKAVAIDLETVAGNYIIVQIAPNRFALYAHLQPHSLLVKRGDKVKSGQVLAKLGNSGNSDAPHLHFHVCDSNSPLACEGVPYAFTTFNQLGEVPSLEKS